MAGAWIFIGLIVLYALFKLYRNRVTNRGITNAHALRNVLLDDGERCTLIDVRTPSEYRSGHIPSAINIPHDRIAKRPPKRSKDALLVVYCRSGNRSMVARSHLVRHGFGRVVNFGGISKWDGPLVEGAQPGMLAFAPQAE